MKKKYLSVTAGSSPEDAKPIFFSDDSGLVDLVVACLIARLSAGNAVQHQGIGAPFTVN